ncbi:hypothetical protein C0995_006949 [Termitomyces sp. Mi166|nr:hypothetical protein C0995_006949 [Termitomyces sp. Mi166\
MLLSRFALAPRVSSRAFISVLSRSMAHEAVIVAAARTPVGSLNGSLKTFTATQLGAIALKAALESKQIDPAVVQEVYFGNVVQAGVGQNPARQVALNAGLKTSSDATTINKVCASGLKSIILAAQSIQSGDRNVVAAGGMESMSHAPFLIPRQNPAFGKFTAIDSLENDGLWDVYNNFAMGNCGEAAAVKHSITREAQDAHAIESYKRADRAWKSGVFDAEVVPVTVKGKKGDTIVKEDEEYTRVIFDKIPTLRSAFKQGGSITAANSSPLSDGASALILMSAEKAKELGLAPLAKVISWADAGVDPIDFPEAPTITIPQALKKANLTVDDISLFEINEAFSAVVRIAEKVLNIDPAKINVNGGAVALGHAIGNSGSRIIVSLVHALKTGEYGAAGICNGPLPMVSVVDLVGQLPSESEKLETKSAVVVDKKPVDENAEEKNTFVIQEGDEALRLIGAERTVQFSEEYNRKLRRKLDLLIPPLCAAVYFTQFLDKTSLNYASIMGLPITGQHYNLLSLAFYVGFLAWEFPTVYISQKLRLAKYLGANVVLWGIVLMLHAIGTSFGAFFTLRVLLGRTGSTNLLVLFDGIAAPHEALHSLTLSSQNGLTQVFGGFVAYGVSFSDGKRLPPYKIIYVLLGGLAILIGISVLIWLPDSPVHARFLSKEERIAALERVRDDQGGTENKILKKSQILEAVTDVGSIVRALKKRPDNLIAILIGLNDSHKKGPLLFGAYLSGTFGSALSTIYAWNASNTSGHTKKSTINAMTLIAFALGNIIGAEIFQPRDAPDYIPGKIAIMVLLTVQLGVCVLLRWINLRMNAKKVAQIEEIKVSKGWTDADIQRERERHAFADLTDKEWDNAQRIRSGIPTLFTQLKFEYDTESFVA